MFSTHLSRPPVPQYVAPSFGGNPSLSLVDQAKINACIQAQIASQTPTGTVNVPAIVRAVGDNCMGGSSYHRRAVHNYLRTAVDGGGLSPNIKITGIKVPIDGIPPSRQILNPDLNGLIKQMIFTAVDQGQTVIDPAPIAEQLRALGVRNPGVNLSQGLRNALAERPDLANNIILQGVRPAAPTAKRVKPGDSPSLPQSYLRPQAKATGGWVIPHRPAE
jgi:hypothetical protein